MSTVAGTSSLQKLEGIDSDGPRKSMQEQEETKEIKHTFRPKSSMDGKVKYTQRASLDNLDPVSKGDITVEVNTRALINMDNEPSYFLQAFQGSLVIRTNEYLQREPQLFSNDQAEECYVMLFQLIGVPNLNQRAREVPPFASSLSQTGLFILITRENVFFWIGADF